MLDKEYKKAAIIKTIITGLSMLLLCMLILVTSIKLYGYMGQETINDIPLNIGVIVLQIVIIIFNAFFNRQIDVIHYGDKEKQIYKLKGKVYSVVEYARQELRFGIQIMFIGAVLLALLIFALTGKMYFSIAIGLMLAIAFIYADYVPHAQFYAKEYDRLCLRDEGKEDKPDEVRGLARIYYSEYQNTHFKNHDKWYEQNDQLEAFDESDNSVERDYILCYLWSHLANVQDTGIIVSVALLVVTVFTADSFFYDRLIEPFGIKPMFFDIVVSVINIFASIVFVLLTFEQMKDYDREQEIVMDDITASQSDNEKIVKRYNKLIREKNSNLINARAKFEYTMLKIEQAGELPEEKYRMLFVHKAIPNRQRFQYTVLLAVTCVLLIMMDFWGATPYLAVPIGIGAGVYIVFGYWILPRIGKRRIAKMCEVLEMTENKGAKTDL